MSGEFLLDPKTGLAYRAGGTATDPGYTVAVNPQDATAQTAGYPALLICAQDKDNDPALIGVYAVSPLLPASTDRSGSATTSSTQLAAANASRRGLEIQNIGANNIGINEQGGAAAIGTAGTYTIAPGGSFKVRTNKQINMIAATGATAFSATEW